MGGQAALYTRISLDQEGEGEGVERQESLCRELADRLGLTVVRTFTDNDRGASDRTRKSKVRHEYQAMLQAVRDRQVDHIIAYSNSRLTRRMRELEDLIQLHEETGVQIHTVVSGNDDLGTADGRMVARIKASVDAGESDRISERSKARYRQKALSGEPRVTSHRPFGWRADGKTLDPVESELIRKGVHDLIRGVPLNVIRKEWTEAGVLTPAGRTVWHWQNTKSVLTSWRTVGVRTYNGEVMRNANGEPVKGKWEAIVSMEEREQALAMIQGRKIQNRRQGKYLLTGLTLCECGRRMWGQKTNSPGRANQYACSEPSRHLSIDAKRLEELVLLDLYAHLANHAIMGRQDAPPEPTKLWEGEGRLRAIQEQIGALMAEFSEERLSGEVVFPQVQALEQERNALRKDRERFLAEAARPKGEPRNLEEVLGLVREVDEHSFEEKQVLLNQEIRAIVISKGVKGVRSRDPEVFKQRVRIDWVRPLDWDTDRAKQFVDQGRHR